MSSILSFATGISVGTQFSRISEKEAEVRKGKNYYQSSLCQAAQLTNIATLGHKISSAIPNPYLSLGCKVGMSATSVAGWVICPVAAAVKQGHFEPGVKFLKSFDRLKQYKIDYLPDQLSENQQKVFRYVAEHLGIGSTHVMVAGTLILPMVGSPYMALGLIAPIGYQMADSRGWVPRKTSLLIETYLPFLVNLGTLAGGGPLAKAATSFNLLTYFSSFNRMIHQKVDKLIKNWFKLSGPSIEDIDTPVIINKDLSFDQIYHILHAKRDKFTVNPAHCSKTNWALQILPKNFDFSKLMELFEKVDWEKYPGLFQSFMDDDRFIDFLKEQFPAKEDVLDHSAYYIDLLAKQENITKEQLLANILKKQMQELIKMLKGERRPEGSQKDAEEAIQYCAQIIPYLLNLDLELRQDRVVCEDILKKLSIEGGEYCARGVKRAAKEIVNGILQESVKAPLDPIQDYEQKLYQALEMARSQLMTRYYKEFIDALVMETKEIAGIEHLNTLMSTDPTAVKIAEDVHTLDLYRLAFSLGFVPLSDYERDSFGLNELNLWSNPLYPFREARLDMYKEYYFKIDNVIKELGYIHFAGYIRSVIEQNKILKPDEIEKVLEIFTECNDNTWSPESTQYRFNRLVCVMLGILTYDSIQDQKWTKVDAPKEIEDGEWTVID